MRTVRRIAGLQVIPVEITLFIALQVRYCVIAIIKYIIANAIQAIPLAIT
jgi:hypothetical protein